MIQIHNSGYGENYTQDAYLRHFSVMAYIFGFGGKNICKYV